MKLCPQTSTQSVYDHCISVRDHLCDLFRTLNDICDNPDRVESDYIWKLPKWCKEDAELILNNLFHIEILIEYAEWHDCGKPFCRVVDEQGRQHFPNHAEVSERVWLEAGGNIETGRLIRMDMDIHTIKAAQVTEFASRPEACSLLITGLAEIHSNAKMFGGIDSTSFKIKYGQIEKRGKAILAHIKEIK